jgi:hypothetical protein
VLLIIIIDGDKQLHRYSSDLQLHFGINRLVLWRRNAHFSAIRTNFRNVASIPRIHIAKIMALREIYGQDKVARAIQDAFNFAAFSSDHIANILEQRERLTVQPVPLHLTRCQNLVDVELAPVDISIYDPTDT